ncbi:hypothetical protein BDR26DRAFT_625677 [Obelidium mucronatum]|nr:hypothetical protein BDR26DRAFT_625677 [Obelidium mucronatum]
MSVSTCLPLAGSTMCPDFVSLNAFITSNLAFITDVAAFDNYIRQSIDTSTAANTFGDQVRTNPVFNCPNWDGTGLRYLQSSLCAYLVGQGVNQAADATPDTPCNPPGTVVPLCASSMTKFGASWNTVFSSRTFCPAGAGSLGAGPSSLVNFILGTQVTLSNEATCIAAEAGEKSNCGFTSAADARKFCATATVAAEPCCSAFPAAACRYERCRQYPHSCCTQVGNSGGDHSSSKLRTTIFRWRNVGRCYCRSWWRCFAPYHRSRCLLLHAKKEARICNQ